MTYLVNQHALAALLQRSRASIVGWSKEGMPVARRGGPGTPTLYDVDQVREWLRRTGRGQRLGPLPGPQPMQTYAPGAHALPAPDALLGRVIDRMLAGAIALMIARGVSGELALEVFDEFVVAAYTALELELGRETVLDADGPIGLLMTDEGRARIMETARALAAQASAKDGAPGDGAAPAN